MAFDSKPHLCHISLQFSRSGPQLSYFSCSPWVLFLCLSTLMSHSPTGSTLNPWWKPRWKHNLGSSTFCEVISISPTLRFENPFVVIHGLFHDYFWWINYFGQSRCPLICCFDIDGMTNEVYTWVAAVIWVVEYETALPLCSSPSDCILAEGLTQMHGQGWQLFSIASP